MIRRSGVRFAEKIMRQLKVSARSDAKPVPTFADRALGIAGESNGGATTGRNPRRGAVRQSRRRLAARRPLYAGGSRAVSGPDRGARRRLAGRCAQRLPVLGAVSRRARLRAV